LAPPAECLKAKTEKENIGYGLILLSNSGKMFRGLVGVWVNLDFCKAAEQHKETKLDTSPPFPPNTAYPAPESCEGPPGNLDHHDEQRQ
jgi:hypothetical protein